VFSSKAASTRNCKELNLVFLFVCLPVCLCVCSLCPVISARMPLFFKATCVADAVPLSGGGDKCGSHPSWETSHRGGAECWWNLRTKPNLCMWRISDLRRSALPTWRAASFAIIFRYLQSTKLEHCNCIALSYRINVFCATCSTTANRNERKKLINSDTPNYIYSRSDLFGISY